MQTCGSRLSAIRAFHLRITIATHFKDHICFCNCPYKRNQSIPYFLHQNVGSFYNNNQKVEDFSRLDHSQSKNLIVLEKVCKSYYYILVINPSVLKYTKCIYQESTELLISTHSKCWLCTMEKDWRSKKHLVKSIFKTDDNTMYLKAIS